MEPTAIDLAFALTINRLKPSDKSVCEYILELRKHIYPGCRPQFSATHEESRQNYINAALYFESQRKEAEREKETLLNEIVSLKRQLAALGEVPGDNLWNTRSSKRRKRAAADGKDSSRMEELSQHIEELAEGFQDFGKNDRCIGLLRRLFDLQTAHNVTPVNFQEVCGHLNKVCSSFCFVLSGLAAKSTEDIPKREHVVKGLPRVIATIFLGLKTANPSTSGEQPSSDVQQAEVRKLNGVLVYNILTIFRGILDAIHNTLATKNKTGTLGRTQAEKASKSVEHQSAGASEATIIPDHLAFVGRTYIALLLQAHSEAKVQASSDSALHEIYPDLLEGTLHLLLSRAGQLLYTITFGTPKGETVEAEILDSSSETHKAAPRSKERRARKNIVNANGAASARDPTSRERHEGSSCNATARQYAETEAQYLTPLLELLLPQFTPSPRLPSAFQRQAPSIEKRRKVNSESASDGSGRMFEKPLRVLQKTLVAGIFGSASSGEEGGLEKDLFGEKLKIPPELSGVDGPCAERAGSEQDEELEKKGEWFARRMWELVGWDVLANGFERGVNGGWVERTDEQLDEQDDYLF